MAGIYRKPANGAGDKQRCEQVWGGVAERGKTVRVNDAVVWNEKAKEVVGEGASSSEKLDRLVEFLLAETECVKLGSSNVSEELSS
jgi:hypothetical protein